MKERNLQMFWPEANPLIRRGVVEPQCGIPDFTAIVRVERVAGAESERVGEVGRERVMADPVVAGSDVRGD
jgi:hypothetical protein